MVTPPRDPNNVRFKSKNTSWQDKRDISEYVRKHLVPYDADRKLIPWLMDWQTWPTNGVNCRWDTKINDQKVADLIGGTACASAVRAVRNELTNGAFLMAQQVVGRQKKAPPPAPEPTPAPAPDTKPHIGLLEVTEKVKAKIMQDEVFRTAIEMLIDQKVEAALDRYTAPHPRLTVVK